MCTSETPLVNGPAPIPDSQITASSEYSALHAPRQARLHNTVGKGAWCPSDQEKTAPILNMYIQVSVRSCEVNIHVIPMACFSGLGCYTNFSLINNNIIVLF